MDENLVTSLIEARAEHKVELRYVKAAIERVFDEIKQIHTRMAKIETLLEIEKKEIASLRPSFFQTVWEYKHIFAIIVAVISFVLTFFFGIHFAGG